MSKSRVLVGGFFKDAREQAGFTQAEVAKKFGYSTPQFISNIERGKCAVPMKVMAQFIKLYKVKPEPVVNLLTRVYKEKVQRELT